MSFEPIKLQILKEIFLKFFINTLMFIFNSNIWVHKTALIRILTVFVEHGFETLIYRQLIYWWCSWQSCVLVGTCISYFTVGHSRVPT
jgi:hypothetical protein